MILRGFRFGMLLQIAIGPVFLYIFKTAAEGGILTAEAGVLAATAADALFVTLAILGIGAVLDKPGVKIVFKYLGTAMLMYFGVGTILGSLGIHIIPTLGHLPSNEAVSNAFVTSFILTASSPLTILFWAGVFATKVSCEGYGKTEMKLFGAGAVLSTLVFLGLFGLLAGMLHMIIPTAIIDVLNAAVGVVLIGFGVRMGLKKV